MTEPEHVEGWFASEQEAVAEEAAWADQMQQEMAGAELVPVAASLPVVVDDEDAPVNPLDIPDHYDLPMHGSITICPKCGMGPRPDATDASPSKTFRTIYHPAGVLGGPCGTRFGWPDVQNLGEHLCRVCNKCGWGWPEAVFHGTP